MGESLKIEILNRTDTQDFEQLKELIKKFLITIHLENKKEYCTINTNKRNEIINRAIIEFDTESNLKYLSSKEIEELQNELTKYIQNAQKMIENKAEENEQSRYYILKDKEKVIAFQHCQIEKHNKIKGWRNSAYIEQEYAGKRGKVLDTNYDFINTFYSDAIYKNIEKWFEENNVEIQRTSTGDNMLRNIYTYIAYKGFLPLGKSNERIFFTKNNKKPIDRSTLIEIYKIYQQNFFRTEEKDRLEIMKELNKDAKLDTLTAKQKNRIATCCLKDGELELEKEKQIIEELNILIQKDLDNKDDKIDYELIKNSIWAIITKATKNNSNDRSIDDIVEIYVKLELMRFKQSNGKITQDYLNNMKKTYKLTNNQINYILDRMIQQGKSINEMLVENNLNNKYLTDIDEER